MTENSESVVRKSKILTFLHIAIPIGLIIVSSLSTVFTYLKLPEGIDSIEYNNSTHMHISTILKIDTPEDQIAINKTLCIFNVVFSFGALIYSKLMSSQNKNIGDEFLKMVEKNTVLESLTQYSASRAISIQHMREPTYDFPEVISETLSPHTMRSDLTVYEKPYDSSRVQISNEPINTVNSPKSDKTVYVEPYAIP